eukprot:PhM_4_TR9473/c4_g2_i1/m.2164
MINDNQSQCVSLDVFIGVVDSVYIFDPYHSVVEISHSPNPIFYFENITLSGLHNLEKFGNCFFVLSNGLCALWICRVCRRYTPLETTSFQIVLPLKVFTFPIY